MKRAGHTSTAPGKRVRVTFRSGAPAVEGRFVESRSREIFVDEEEGCCMRGPDGLIPMKVTAKVKRRRRA